MKFAAIKKNEKNVKPSKVEASKPSKNAKPAKAVKEAKSEKTKRPVKEAVKPVKAIAKPVSKPSKENKSVTPLSSAITKFRGENLRTEPEFSLVLTRGRRILGELVRNVYDENVRSASEDTEISLKKKATAEITTVVLFTTDDSAKIVKSELAKEIEKRSSDDVEFSFNPSEMEYEDGNVSVVLTATVRELSDTVAAVIKENA
jgi:hypothetical protein